MLGDFGSNYPDSMTRSEYNQHFEDDEVNYEDSLCKLCKRGKPYKEGCLCDNNSYLASYEMPARDEQCDEYVEAD